MMPLSTGSSVRRPRNDADAAEGAGGCGRMVCPGAAFSGSEADAEPPATGSGRALSDVEATKFAHLVGMHKSVSAHWAGIIAADYCSNKQVRSSCQLCCIRFSSEL